MAEDQHELSSDELDGVAGGGGQIGVPIESQASKFVRQVKSEGLTKEQALERYKDVPGLRYRWIKEYWH